MSKVYVITALLSLVFFTSMGVNAQEVSETEHGPAHEEVMDNDGGRINTSEEINEYIQHHLKDAHDFHVFSYTSDDGERKHVGFPLPVMVWTTEGLQVFMSSKFHHDDAGEVIVESGGARLVKLHSKIYELDAGANALSFDEEHHPTNAHKVLDFSITKSVFGTLFIGLLLVIFFGRLAKQYKKKSIPTGFSRVLEPLVIYIRDEIARPNIGEQKHKKFMPYLLTVFFLIWIANLLGLTPFGFNITGQLAVTACLAIFTLVIYLVSGNKDFWMHMLWMPGIPVIFKPILAVIELVGFLLIKPFSLLMRLFANITAGHFVLMSLIALMITLKAQFGPIGSTGVSLFLALFIMVIELLVAFLQAFIFTMLSALFIGMAVAEHDHAEHAHTPEDDIDEVRERFI
ncbi:F0F1 ATP synthase subunit A [Nonlabens sp. YIK11]|uniref:F0F1 ATP synthase subunit A n=1 Tax=Nonlabens sp. YIK11 TaxID=1453349 RepID=UPI0009E95812